MKVETTVSVSQSGQSIFPVKSLYIYIYIKYKSNCKRFSLSILRGKETLKVRFTKITTLWVWNIDIIENVKTFDEYPQFYIY